MGVAGAPLAAVQSCMLPRGIAAHPSPACLSLAALQTNYACGEGEVITGLDVAWEPAPVAPFTNIATGMRIYCASPDVCAAAASPAPAPAAASAAPGPNYAQLPVGAWSDWYGPVKGPPYYGGICPCNTILQVRCRWLRWGCGLAARVLVCPGANTAPAVLCAPSCSNWLCGVTIGLLTPLLRLARWRGSQAIAKDPTPTPLW